MIHINEILGVKVAFSAPMRTTVGKYAYCLGCFLSGVIVGLGIWVALTDDREGLWPLPVFLVGAAIVWVLGRIARNMLADTRAS